MVAYIKAISLSKHLTQFPLTYKSPVAIIFLSKDFCPRRSLLHWYYGNCGGKQIIQDRGHKFPGQINHILTDKKGRIVLHRIEQKSLIRVHRSFTENISVAELQTQRCHAELWAWALGFKA